MRVFTKSLLALLLTLCSYSVWAYDFMVDGVCYNITSSSNRTVGVTYTGANQGTASDYEGVVTIPETVSYQGTTYTVTSIGQFAFYQAYNVTAVTMPNTITTIGQNTFYNCTGITEMVLSEGVTSLGQYAFQGCTALEKVTIPSALATLDTYTFYNCTALKEIELPSTLTQIGQRVFYNCSALKEIELPSTLTQIGQYAFSGCSALTTVSVPDEVTTMDTYIFQDCTSLVSAKLPKGMESISGGTFSGCSSLKEVTLPEAPTTFGNYLFQNCTAIEKIDIPQTVTSLGTYDFVGCSSLTDVTLPEGLTSLPNYLFQNCTKLETVVIPDGVTSFGTYLFQGCTSLKSLTIPENVSTLGNYDFEGCTALEEMVVPNLITTSGTYLFQNCTNLKKVTYGSRMATLSNYAMNGCTALTDIYVLNPNFTKLNNSNSYTNVPTTCKVHVPQQAYSSYSSDSNWKNFDVVAENILTVVTDAATSVTGTSAVVNATITSYGETILDQGFYYYASSSDIHRISATGTETMSATIYDLPIKTKQTFYAYVTTAEGTIYGADATFTTETSDVTVDGLKYYVVSAEDKTCAVSYSGTSSTTATTYSGDIVVPETVAYNGENYTVVGIGDHAFYDNSKGNITSVSLPKTITFLDGSAFRGCNKVEKFDLPEGLVSIGDYAFQNCVSLTEIEIPTTVTTIDTYAFYGCSALTTVTVPDNVTSLGTYTFASCTGLESVSFGKGITEYPNYVCNNCSALKEVNVGSWVTNVGQYAFQQTGVEKVTFDNSPATIQQRAFYQCVSLKEVDLGDSIRSIGSYCFYRDSLIVEIAIPGTCTEIGSEAFEQCYKLAKVDIADNGGMTIGSKAFLNCTRLKEIHFGEGITSFGGYVCQNDTLLTEVTLPSSLLSTSSWEFQYCYGLKTVTLKYNSEPLTVGGNGLFYDCPIETAYIDREYTTFTGVNPNYNIFQGLETLTTVVIGDSVKSIIPEAFYECTNLEKVTWGKSLQTIGDHAFYGCTALPSELVLPDELEYIGDYAFRECTSLTSVEVGDKVTYIGPGAFYDCSAITEVTIGAAVEEIDDYAFSGDSQIVKVTSLNTTPPTCWTSVFGGVDTSICELYVPEGSYEDYTTASTWKDFYNTIEMIKFEVLTYEATNVAETSATLNGFVKEGYDAPVSRKGFVYWSSDPNVVQVIIISDEDVEMEMSYTLNSLTPETTYTYRAFAVTTSGTTYGDDVEFTTLEDSTTGINGIHISMDDENVEGIYSTSGQKLNTTVKGVNIIRYVDGTVKKLYVK